MSGWPSSPTGLTPRRGARSWWRCTLGSQWSRRRSNAHHRSPVMSTNRNNRWKHGIIPHCMNDPQAEGHMASYIARRKFLATLGGAVAWPLAARGQQPAIPVIGVLYGVSAAERAEHMEAFRRGLGETGFVEGRNVAIEYRWADGQLDRMPWMAADLIGRRVAVILMGGNTAAVRSLLSATQTIPIVFTSGADPVVAGLVASLNRPGGNATGVTMAGSELGPKRLELLHEVVPAVKKIAILVNQNNRVTSEADIRGARAAALPLGLEVIVVNGGAENEIETAFATAVQQGAGAVYIGDDAGRSRGQKDRDPRESEQTRHVGGRYPRCGRRRYRSGWR